MGAIGSGARLRAGDAPNAAGRHIPFVADQPIGGNAARRRRPAKGSFVFSSSARTRHPRTTTLSGPSRRTLAIECSVRTSISLSCTRIASLILGRILVADLEILSIIPSTHTSGPKIPVRAFGEITVLGTVADEARVETDRLRSADDSRKILDQSLGHTAAAEECLRDS